MTPFGKYKNISTDIVLETDTTYNINHFYFLASEIKVSLGSMQNLVKNDLHLKSFKRKKVHSLSDKITQKRPIRSKGLLTRLATLLLDNILFSDEKLFTREEATNKQNDRILKIFDQKCTQ